MAGDTGTHDKRIGEDAGALPAGALSVIANELLETLRNAHGALEDCVDGRGGTAALVRAGELLHQVRGALQIAETYGAALLAEEMELCCKHLSDLSAGKGREDGLDALTRAMVQLPTYIERLLAGGRDIALVLLPMLNDLRASRGQPLLSEGTLLLLNLSPERSGKTVEERQGGCGARTGGNPRGHVPAVVGSRRRARVVADEWATDFGCTETLARSDRPANQEPHRRRR